MTDLTNNKANNDNNIAPRREFLLCQTADSWTRIERRRFER